MLGWTLFRTSFKSSWRRFALISGAVGVGFAVMLLFTAMFGPFMSSGRDVFIDFVDQHLAELDGAAIEHIFSLASLNHQLQDDDIASAIIAGLGAIEGELYNKTGKAELRRLIDAYRKEQRPQEQ